ncbi:ParA family protein [Pseudomonadales bacterium]|nr:ParA family protein [Pseudomonadales bacterium]
MKVFAVVNQKGGVGKTTTSVNLAACLAAMRRRVLLIDLDAQGNATMGCGVNKAALTESVYDVLILNHDLQDVMVDGAAGLKVVGANADLTGAEIDLLDLEDREYRLKSALGRARDEFDYVVIDCPPALNLLTINALTAATSLIIPMQCEYYALEGLSALVETIKRVVAHLNPSLQIEGIVRTMFDPRNSLTKDVSEQLQQHFGDKLYRTVIPRNVRLAEAPSHGLPIVAYDPTSSGAKAYLALAGELVRREQDAASLMVLGAQDAVTQTD